MPDKKIVGNIVGLPSPRSDWNQTDEKKADFIKNKPDIVSQSEFDELKNWLEENGANLVRFIPTINILYEALGQNAENTKNIVGESGFAVGYTNEVNSCSLAVGLQNILKGFRSFCAGQGLNSYSESNRAYFGQFNAKNGQAVLTVGWGTSDSNRKNIFTVDKSGNGRFTGLVYSDGEQVATMTALTILEESLLKSILDINKQLTTRIAELENTYTNLETTLSRFYDQIGQFNSILDTQQMQIANLQDEIANLKNK